MEFGILEFGILGFGILGFGILGFGILDSGYWNSGYWEFGILGIRDIGIREIGIRDIVCFGKWSNSGYWHSGYWLREKVHSGKWHSGNRTVTIIYTFICKTWCFISTITQNLWFSLFYYNWSTWCRFYHFENNDNDNLFIFLKLLKAYYCLLLHV